MQQKIQLQVLPSEAADESLLKNRLAEACALTPQQISGYQLLKKSIDARSRQVKINLTVLVYINEPFQEIQLQPLHLKNVHRANKKTIIVGAGPAGLLAAIRLIESGIKPIILERGKDVRARRRDLAKMN